MVDVDNNCATYFIGLETEKIQYKNVKKKQRIYVRNNNYTLSHAAIAQHATGAHHSRYYILLLKKGATVSQQIFVCFPRKGTDFDRKNLKPTGTVCRFTYRTSL